MERKRLDISVEYSRRSSREESLTTHLQYDDNTLIMIKSDQTGSVNLKFPLICFESMSGLKINYDKSEATITGGDLEDALRATHMMN